MQAWRNSSWTRMPALFAVVAILSGALMSHAAMAQEEKVVAQVGSMPDDWAKRFPAGLKNVYKGKAARARGLVDPVPQGGGSPGGLKGTPYSERIARFNPGQYADRVKVPTLLIDAEKEHYFKIEENAGRVHEILKANDVPTEYRVLKGKKHYDVYSGQTLDEVMKREIAWFDKYLKGEK